MATKITRLRALMVNRGGPKSRTKPLTLADLSARTGYSRGHLSDVVQGKTPAGDKMISALAKTFGKSVATMRRTCSETFREGPHAA